MNRHFVVYISIYLLLQTSECAFSQNTYIVDSAYFQKITSLYFLKNIHKHTYKYLDTSIIQFQNSLPFYFNGQIGSAQPDFLLQQQNTNHIGSRILNVYYPDILNWEDIELYRTKGFFAQMQGIAGSKDEQHFKALFVSPISHHQQINFYLRRSTNTGFYLNQKSSITNFYIDYHLFGNKKISMDAGILLNYIKHQENGGIIKDTLSYNDLFVDKSLIPIALSSARKQIHSHQLKYHLHYSLQNDSTHSHTLSFAILAYRNIYQYQDNLPRSGYYPHIFLDTLKTNDSLHSILINCPVTYTYQKRSFITQIYYMYQWNNIYMYLDTNIQNHFVGTRWEKSFKILSHIQSNQIYDLKYIINGTQKNNYDVNITYWFKYHQWALYLHIKALEQSPSFQQNFWYSNHFIWYHQFKNIIQQQLTASLHYTHHIQFSYRFIHSERFIFWMDNYPQQYASHVFIHQLHTQLHYVFFKHLGCDISYYYQWKNSPIIALPSHFIKADIYYQGRWFRKNLLVNIGTQYINTFKHFDTYQYTPATGIYNITSSSFQTGNYPQIGIYFSGRIKPVNFFIRVDNLLSGLYPQPYYFLPHFMMPDRSIRMGIQWMFFD